MFLILQLPPLLHRKYLTCRIVFMRLSREIKDFKSNSVISHYIIFKTIATNTRYVKWYRYYIILYLRILLPNILWTCKFGILSVNVDVCDDIIQQYTAHYSLSVKWSSTKQGDLDDAREITAVRTYFTDNQFEQLFKIF